MLNEDGLTSFWPIIDGNTYDFIQGNDFKSRLPLFRKNRLNEELSSVYINTESNIYEAPPGIYFYESLSITVWAKVFANRLWSRVIDFGSTKTPRNNVFLALSASSTLIPVYGNFNGANIENYFMNRNITLNEWIHLAVTHTENTVNFYLNGQLTNTHTNYTKPFILRRINCFLGKSNWGIDEIADAEFDDIRIYNRSLSNEEIVRVMNQTVKFLLE